MIYDLIILIHKTCTIMVYLYFSVIIRGSVYLYSQNRAVCSDILSVKNTGNPTNLIVSQLDPSGFMDTV